MGNFAWNNQTLLIDSFRLLRLWRSRLSQKHGVKKQRLPLMILSWRPSIIQIWRKSSRISVFWDPPISQLLRERRWVDNWSCGRWSWQRSQMCFDYSLCFLSTVPFWARWTESTQLQRCVLQRNAGLWSLVRNAPNTLLMFVSEGQTKGESTHAYAQGSTRACNTTKELCFR